MIKKVSVLSKSQDKADLIMCRPRCNCAVDHFQMIQRMRQFCAIRQNHKSALLSQIFCQDSVILAAGFDVGQACIELVHQLLFSALKTTKP